MPTEIDAEIRRLTTTNTTGLAVALIEIGVVTQSGGAVTCARLQKPFGPAVLTRTVRDVLDAAPDATAG